VLVSLQQDRRLQESALVLESRHGLACHLGSAGLRHLAVSVPVYPAHSFVVLALVQSLQPVPRLFLPWLLFLLELLPQPQAPTRKISGWQTERYHPVLITFPVQSAHH